MTTQTTTRRYGFYRRDQAEAMRDSFRAQGYKAQLTGRWNVNGGGVRVEFPEGADADTAEATARAAVTEFVRVQADLDRELQNGWV